MSQNIPKILVVDDTKFHLYLLESILSDLGFDVESINDSRMVMKTIQERDFDLIILDLMMPNIDGFQILKELTQDRQKQSIPVIILSAKSDSKSIQKTMDMGAQDYIVKPINVRDVQNKVMSILNHKKYM